MSNDQQDCDLSLEDGQAERTFLAHMRHELRTPLNAIIGYSEMLLEDAPQAFTAALEKIHSSGRRLLSLVNEILDPVKIEAAKIDLELESFGARLRHELRTPLNAIIGYSELLLKEVAGPGHTAFAADIQNIRAAAKRLLALIEEIVNLSHIEADRATLDLKSSGVSRMAQEAVSAIRPLKEDKQNGGFLLVVDDNEINRDILSRRLGREGHTVRVARNGVEALQMIRAEKFDLVLLDIMMPEMNGYQVLEHIKADDGLREIPVIMISALDEIDSVVRCIEMGAEDYLPKPFNPVLLRARIGACLEKKRLRDQEMQYLRELQKLNEELNVRNVFIRQVFGRYLSDELVESLFETPEGLKLGGEARKVTILMSDLRGFTSLAERLSPAKVVTLLNIYLGTMADIITGYQGTIDEFIGDAILVIFGAPIRREDDAERAVACAVSMQLAMESINEQNRREGLPEVAMGIGINTGEVVAGNIGSLKRTKYGVIGRHVNLTSRIESYTVGDQILVSEDTLKDVGYILRVDGQMRVEPKGVKEPITIYEVGGIGGNYNLFLPKKADLLISLQKELGLRYTVIEGKHIGQTIFEGRIVMLSSSRAEVRSEHEVAPMSNIKMRLIGQNGEELPGDLYGKVLGKPNHGGTDFYVYFTSIPPELAPFFRNLLVAHDGALE